MHSSTLQRIMLSFGLLALFAKIAAAIPVALGGDMVADCCKPPPGGHHPRNLEARQDHHVRQEGSTAGELEEFSNTVTSKWLFINSFRNGTLSSRI